MYKTMVVLASLHSGIISGDGDPGQQQQQQQDPGPQQQQQDPGQQQQDPGQQQQQQQDPGQQQQQQDPGQQQQQQDPGQQQPEFTFKPEEYKIPEGLPGEIKNFASQHKLSQDQLDGTLEYFNKILENQENYRQQTLKKEGNDFIETWGNEKDYKVNLANRALEINDPKGELTNVLKQTGFGNHPAVIQFLYTIGESLREGGFITNSSTPVPGKATAKDMYPNTDHN